jgi:hypothetical protein
MKIIFRNSISTLLSLALILSIAVPAHAEGESWIGGGVPSPGNIYFEINEVAHENNSFRAIFNSPENSVPFAQYYCPQFNVSANCTLPEAANPALRIPNVFAVFPTCKLATSQNCVEDLFVANKDGQLVKGEFIRNVGGPSYPEDQKLGLIEASTQSLFRVPGVINAGGTDTYAVTVRAQQDYNTELKKFEIGQFAATVLPYRDTQSGDSTSSYREMVQSNGVQIISGEGGNARCVWSDSGHCGIPLLFSDGQQVKLAFRATNRLSGWFSGRIQRPDLKIEAISPVSNRFTISGSPVMVPQMHVVVPKNSSNPFVVDTLKRNPNVVGVSNSPQSGDGNFYLLSQLKDESKDTAAGFENPFSLRTVRGGAGCLADTSRVLGIVSTDAMVYDGAPPVFSDNQLVYHVAGLHFKPDGVTPIQGSYDLVMRSDVARCLYGFSSAPVSVSVSVIGENGDSKVATTAVSEKDGWLKMGAYGFTFSNPKISVLMTQAQPLVPISKSLTCVRGKLTKKVVAPSPKCPAGYKKKV